MPANYVDVVFVIDASSSMRPYIDALKTHIRSFVEPLEQCQMNIRFGIVSHSVVAEKMYRISFMKDVSNDVLRNLYSEQHDDSNFFTTDVNKFKEVLTSIEAYGDEHTPLAIDFATDFPFGPVSTTRRAIVFFSDEMIETGYMEPGWEAILDKLVDKIMSRKIMLFGFLPESKSALVLSEAERSEITFINDFEMQNMDLSKILEKIGKSISVSLLQVGKESPYEKALFGQNKWFAKDGKLVSI